MTTPYRPTLFKDVYKRASGFLEENPQFLTNLLGLGMNWYSSSVPSVALSNYNQAVEYDTFGRPVYTAGQAFNEAINMKPRGATATDILSGAVSGAQAGSAFGLPGAIVGTAVGALGSLFFGERRKKKEREARRRALQSVFTNQGLYNKAMQEYENRLAADQSWRDRLYNPNRLYALYGGPQLIYY